METVCTNSKNYVSHVIKVCDCLFFQEELEGADNDDADDMPEIQETVSVIPGSTLLWRIDSRPPQSAVVKYDY